METLWEGLVAMGFSRRGRAAAGRIGRLTKLAGCVMVVASLEGRQLAPVQQNTLIIGRTLTTFTMTGSSSTASTP